MTSNLFFGGLALPAVLFTLGYFPVLKLSLALVSPYAKANLRDRVAGAAIDSLVVTTCWAGYWNLGSLPFGVAALLYLLLRDAIGGQSIGKFMVGQVVVYVDSGERCRLGGSIMRNLFLVLPGANLAAIFLEAHTLMQDSQGQRLGDRLAHTQVIEGSGAREVIGSLQKWWATFLGDLAGRPHRGTRHPLSRRTDGKWY